jgi:hypothetical protein
MKRTKIFINCKKHTDIHKSKLTTTLKEVKTISFQQTFGVSTLISFVAGINFPFFLSYVPKQ